MGCTFFLCFFNRHKTKNMIVTISNIIQCLDEIAPFGMAESWDNVGLIVGNRNREVKSILLGLDPTNRLLEEAVKKKADTVVTHHPAIFKPIPSINTADPSGSFLEKALTSRLNILACHTNFDSACNGVNDAFADLLGLVEVKPLVPDASHEGAGMGRIGRYQTARSKQEFLDLLLDALDLDSVQVAGLVPDKITTVALCGGSGSDFAELARSSGADLYISAEIKHNTGRWADEIGFCIIDGTHYATEKPAMRLLAEHLRYYSKKQGWNLTILETTTEKHPFSTVDKKSYG